MDTGIRRRLLQWHEPRTPNLRVCAGLQWARRRSVHAPDDRPGTVPRGPARSWRRRCQPCRTGGTGCPCCRRHAAPEGAPMSILQLLRPEIRAMHAYDAAEQVDDTIRLNANESPRRSTIGNFRRPLNRYPEVRPQKLQSALAERFGCSAEQLLVTRGSSEAIDLVVRAFCRAGKDSVLVTNPSFSMYRHYAEVQGANLIEVDTLAEQDFAIDVDAILAACTDSTRLIFVCSPNNPTG